MINGNETDMHTELARKPSRVIHRCGNKQEHITLHERPADSEQRISIGQHKFQGPYVNLAFVSEMPGLLALFAESEGVLELLSLTESENLKHSARFVSHDGYSRLSIAILCTPHLNRAARQDLLDAILSSVGCTAGVCNN